MATRREITKIYREEYRNSSKDRKAAILDEIVLLTSWNRKYAISVLNKPTLSAIKKVKSNVKRGGEYLDVTVDALNKVWVTTNYMNSKSLQVMMPIYVRNMRSNGHLSKYDGCWDKVESQLLKMSPATIDRKLRPYKENLKIKGKSLTRNTKDGTRLRDSFKLRRVGDEVPARPGFIENDTVSHCGGDAKGDFCRTLTSTDIHTGWSENVAVQNNSHSNIRKAFDIVVMRLPLIIEGMDYDNGSEFINKGMLSWHEENGILITTRSRPYKKNDNAHVEQKNNDIVRKYAMYYRYDTKEELDLLNELYELVRIKFNLFTPTKKARGYVDRGGGRKTRTYDKPRTPFDRLKESGYGKPRMIEELQKVFDETDLFELQERIRTLQKKLVSLARCKNGFNELTGLIQPLNDVALVG